MQPQRSSHHTLPPPVVVPPGCAMHVRGEGIPYFVKGLEDGQLSFPTPLRGLPAADGQASSLFLLHKPRSALFTDEEDEPGGTELSQKEEDGGLHHPSRSQHVSPFSLASLDPRYRYTLHEAEIIQLLEFSDALIVGRSPDEGLRQLVWGGAPPSHRAECWRVLLDLSPASGREELRRTLLQRKRSEYHGFVRRYYYGSSSSHHHPADPALLGGGGGVSAVLAPPPLESRGPQERQILQQLALDLPRHKNALFHDQRTVTRLERMLFLWSLRHPAVGFVQGLDDILVQFFYVFIGEALEQRYKDWIVERRAAKRSKVKAMPPIGQKSNKGSSRLSLDTAAAGGGGGGDRRTGTPNSAAGSEAEVQRALDFGNEQSTTTTTSRSSQPLVVPSAAVMQSLSWQSVLSRSDDVFSAALDTIAEDALDDAEADAYWCGGRMLSWVQENFVSRQPGLIKMMNDFGQLVKRVDPPLSHYICETMQVALPQACFQWLHCMLTRELPGRLVLRLWDTYLAIGPEGFRAFHLFVCTALLQDIRRDLITAPFDVIMTKLKFPKPEEQWPQLTTEWLDGLIAQAYVLSVKYPITQQQQQQSLRT